jgi:hypothetical protein
MRHIDRAHLSMMRHLSAQARRKGANSVAEQIGRTGHAPVQRDTALARAQQSFRRDQQAAARSMAHPHHTHVKSSIQRGLEAIGLGGAAHPIRRLHHPGGQAVFPFAGRGVAGKALGRAVTMSKRERAVARAHGVPESKLDQWDAHARAHPFRAIAENIAIRSDNKATGMGEQLMDAYIKASLTGAAATAVYGITHPDKKPKGGWPKDTAPPLLTGPLYTKKQTENQAAKDRAKLAAYHADLDWLVRSGQMKPAEARQAHEWGDRRAAHEGLVDVGNARNYMRNTFKAPPRGWTKAP